MESYVQKSFGDLTNDLEKFESQPPADTTVIPADTPSIVDTATPIAENQTIADTVEPVKEVQQDSSDFSISLEGEVIDTTPIADTTTPVQYNFDEELKKIDKKEVLKKLGVNDFAIEMDEYLLKGGLAEDFITKRGVDWSRVSDEELVKADLKKFYGDNISQHQLDRLYNKKYNQQEIDSEEDKEDGVLLMQAEAKRIREAKISEQKYFKIPDTPILQKDEAYEQWKQEQQTQPQQLEKFRSYYDNHVATKALNESKRVTINLGDGVAPFNFNVDRPDMITKAMTDGGVIMNKLTATQSGEPDVAKQQLITLFSYNPQKVLQDVFNYGQSMGVRKELVEEGQNAQRPQAKVAQMQNDGTQTVRLNKFGDMGR